VAPGQTVRLTVLRDGHERELPVQVGRRPGQG
jgi:serine protease Do